MGQQQQQQYQILLVASIRISLILDEILPKHHDYDGYEIPERRICDGAYGLRASVRSSLDLYLDSVGWLVLPGIIPVCRSTTTELFFFKAGASSNRSAGHLAPHDHRTNTVFVSVWIV